MTMHNPFHDAQRQLARAADVIDLPRVVRTRLERPDHALEFDLPITMDDGSTKTFHGYRIQYNNILGPYKGGLRYHPKVDLNEATALAFWMTMKTAAVGLPYGGGKGGITVDPKTLSRQELERLSRAWVRAAFPYIGPERDIPAPDVNTNPQIMAWMVDEYSQLAKKFEPAAFTGKPLELGGAAGRETSTARGGVSILEELMHQLKRDPKESTVAVQGFGNVGFHTARLLHAAGYKIIALSDSRGGIYDKRGLGMDPANVMKTKQEKGLIDGCYCLGTVCDCENYAQITNAELLELPVDVLVPAALEDVITADNVARVRAKIILEMANGPTTPDADAAFAKRGVTVVPDILANAGGVAGSYLEWKQNRLGEQWSEQQFFEQLEPLMRQAFKDIWSVTQDKHIDLRTAAYVVALQRIAKGLPKS